MATRKQIHHLGFDLGSISLKAALLDEGLDVVFNRWMRVAGAPMDALHALIAELKRLYPDSTLAGIGVTGSGRGLIIDALGAIAVNEITAQAAACARLCPEARSVIEIGGQDSKFIILDEGRPPDVPTSLGRFVPRPTSHVPRYFAMNELCAAGTGAFLDQQAARFSLSIEEFAGLALDSTHPVPIAGRCAVFAKTDMTHHQQEGRPLPDIVAGLNEALVRSYLANLMRGKELPKPISFQGGVAANTSLAAAFRKILNLGEGDLIVPDNHRVMGAIGAALIAAKRPRRTRDEGRGTRDVTSTTQLSFRPSSFVRRPSVVSSLVHRLIPSTRDPLDPDFTHLELDGLYLGIDIGSVSAKVVALGPDGIAYSDYRLTDGRPIEALRAMLSELEDVILSDPAEGGERRIPWSPWGGKFAGVGITGSGRHFVGKLIGADVIQNEITAQARAAKFLFPDVDTVIEIGGQDSKFIILDEGRPLAEFTLSNVEGLARTRDVTSPHPDVPMSLGRFVPRPSSLVLRHFQMNRVCAAGTGAFLQEQAKRLDIDLERDFAREAFESVTPADLGARCAVFMESDLVSHQQQGYSRRDLIAGLARSVVQNYLEKVVAGIPIGERILFIGGVAENRAVVAALEAELGKSVATSGIGKISGAVGAALAAFEARKGGRYRDSGFSFKSAGLDYEQFNCADCPNSCRITRTKGDASRTFGGRCGKWDIAASRRPVVNSYLKKRLNLLERCNERRRDVTSHVPRPTSIGIPRALFTFDRFPAWRAYFEALCCEVVLSPPSDEHLLSEGMKHLVVETCLPVKAFCAHLRWLEENGNVDFIFVPSLVITGQDRHGKETMHCPYIQSMVQFARPIVKTPILNPVINWRWHPKDEERAMSALAEKLGAARTDGRRAWREAMIELDGFRAELKKLGGDVLSMLAGGRLDRAFVILGKDYNVCDPALNSRAAEIIESMGETLITQDMIADDSGAYSSAYRQMYWSHSKEILAAAEIAAKTPGLYPVMITNFGCGPDSFTIRFARDIMGGKPMLLLEVDEHSSSVGMETRIEAFLDSLPKAGSVRSRPARRPFRARHGIRRVFLPNFSDHGLAFASAIRILGLEPILTDLPDDESARLGAANATCGECHPYAIMLGDYVKTASAGEDFSDACYLMPESGACRVGLFGAQMRLVAEDLGLKLPIFTRVEDLAGSISGTSRGTYVRALTTYWEMMRGCDFLMQEFFETRAYEIVSGSADQAHEEGRREFFGCILRGHPHEGLRRARELLGAVDVDRNRERVRIGITGDYYTRVCSFANADIFRDIERLGGVVMLPPTMSEFVKYDAHQKPAAAIRHRRPADFLQSLIVRSLVGRREKRVRRLFDGALDYDIPLEYNRAMELIGPYMAPKLPAGLTWSVAAVMEQIRAGADGILSLITFHCSYGLVLGSVLASIDKDYPDIPKLTLIFEGLKPTHNRTRIEAFMERVWERRKP